RAPKPIITGDMERPPLVRVPFHYSARDGEIPALRRPFRNFLRGRRSDLGMLAIPVDGPAKPLLEANRRLPAHDGVDLGGVDVLAIDLARGVSLAAYVWLDVGAGK